MKTESLKKYNNNNREWEKTFGSDGYVYVTSDHFTDLYSPTNSSLNA